MIIGGVFNVFSFPFLTDVMRNKNKAYYKFMGVGLRTILSVVIPVSFPYGGSVCVWGCLEMAVLLHSRHSVVVFLHYWTPDFVVRIQLYLAFGKMK